MASLYFPSTKFAIRPAFFIIIFSIGSFCIAEINAGEVVGEVLGERGSEQREFDYFKLALQWPGTYCRKTRRCCSSNGCCRGSDGPTGFTIHGLWADYNDGTWPSCCTGKKFDLKKVATLLGALNKYWPSLSCGSVSNCYGGKGLFWEHEKNTELVPLQLQEMNTTTSRQHLIFTSSITSPKFCKKLGDAVVELYLCFDKYFKPRDCAVESITARGIVNSSKSCPSYVMLPELGNRESTVRSSI